MAVRAATAPCIRTYSRVSCVRQYTTPPPLQTFRDLVQTRFSQSRTPETQMPRLHETAAAAMAQYRTLLPTHHFTTLEIAPLLTLVNDVKRCANALRSNYNAVQMTQLPATVHEAEGAVVAYLREISDDVALGRIPSTPGIVLYLFMMFDKNRLGDAGIRWWNDARTRVENGDEFLRGNVMGRVLVAFCQYTDEPFDVLEALYRRLRVLLTPRQLPQLQVGFISVCLKHNRVELALETFEDVMAQTDPSDIVTSLVLYRLHEEFISVCQDLDVAELFLDRFIEQRMPYLNRVTTTTGSRFLNNIWNATSDFERCARVWEKVWRFYVRTNEAAQNDGMILVSWNRVFFDIFMKKYPEFSRESYRALQKVIERYAAVKPIDEPFLNMMLMSVSVWGNRGVVKSIYQAYDTYGMPRSTFSERAHLHALGKVAVSPEEVAAAWIRLVENVDKLGLPGLASSDLSALAAATIDSEYAQERREVYFRLFKTFGGYAASQAVFTSAVRDGMRHPLMRSGYERIAEFEPWTCPELVNLKRF